MLEKNLATRNDKIIADIRSNAAFETMLDSIVTATALSAAAHLLIGLGWRGAGGLLTASGVLSAFLEAATFAVIFFLAGFAFSIVVGVPLYRALERAKLRRAAPYAGAAFAMGFIFLVLLGRAPTFDAPANALYLIPGVAAALLFARKMAPHWRAAARMEEVQPEIFRLH